MDIKVTTSDEPGQNVATASPNPPAADIVQPEAAVAAPPAPVMTEPAAPPATPEPLPTEPEPIDQPQPAMAGGTDLPSSPLTATPMPAKKKSKPMLVIIIAVVVVLAIAAAVVFAFVKSRDKGVPTPAVSNQTSKVSSSDVNATSQEIDKSLKTVDDSKDFNGTDISDQALGL